MCTKKTTSFCQVLKKMHTKENWFFFFCLTVYICEISYHIDSKPVTTRDRFSSRGAANRANIASCAVYRIWWGRRLRRRCTSASRTWRSRRTAAPCTCTSCRARPPTDTVYAHTRPSIHQSINPSSMQSLSTISTDAESIRSLAQRVGRLPTITYLLSRLMDENEGHSPTPNICPFGPNQCIVSYPNPKPQP